MRGTTELQGDGKKPAGRAPGFTLIEMLVVVAIIGILAGIILAALPAIKGKANRARIRTELAKIEVAINSYKAKKGVFPPDNPANPKQPPLYYELTGTLQEDSANGVRYRSLHSPSDPPLGSGTLKTEFGIDGFVNTGPDKNEVDNFFKAGLNPGDVRTTPGVVPVKILVAPYKGETGDLAVWYYNSSTPVHNPNEYDLWVEIIMGGKKEIIGNWKD